MIHLLGLVIDPQRKTDAFCLDVKKIKKTGRENILLQTTQTVRKHGLQINSGWALTINAKHGASILGIKISLCCSELNISNNKNDPFNKMNGVLTHQGFLMFLTTASFVRLVSKH